MHIDMRKELPVFRAHIAKRVQEHMSSANAHLPVQMVVFGFCLFQGNWVAVVFDTRPDAQMDGEWTRWMECFDRPTWPDVENLPDNEPIYFTLLNGNTVTIDENADENSCRIVGEVMTQALLEARDEGVFKPLNASPNCRLAIENMEGHFGWPEYENPVFLNPAAPPAPKPSKQKTSKSKPAKSKPAKKKAPKSSAPKSVAAKADKRKSGKKTAPKKPAKTKSAPKAPVKKTVAKKAPVKKSAGKKTTAKKTASKKKKA